MSEHEFGVDIAERQQAEQAQRRMDELFRALIENALDVITILDAEGVIRYQSPSVERVLGYKPAELIGLNIVELLHPDDVPKVNVALKAAAPPNGTPGIAQVVEARLRHKDGSWRILESIGKALPSGLPMTGIVVNSRDITERKRAEEALRESEERYRELVNTSIDGVISVDPQMRIALWNLGAERIFGCTGEEMLGQSLIKIVPEGYRKAKKTGFARFRKTGSGPLIGATLELEGLRKDGTEVPIELSLSSRRVGETHIATAIVRDITERRRAEEELRETRDYLDSLIRYASAPIIVWDPQGRITQFNHAFEHLTGYTADEVIGQELRILFPEASRDESLQEIAHTLSGEYWESVEIPILRKDGDIRVALWNSANIHAKDGTTLLATIAQGHDITERKRAEEALRERESRYRTLVENIPQKIFTKDRNLVYVSANENFARDLGIAPEEFVGKTDYDFFSRELADKYRADDKRIMESGKTEEIEEKYVQHGQEVWVQTVKTPIRDGQGKVVGILGIFWDITGRKQMEKALRESEEHFRTLVTGASDVITVTDLEGNILFINEAGKTLHGADDLNALTGRNAFSLIAEESLESAREGMEIVLRDGVAKSREYVLVRDDGEKVPVEITISLIRDVDGKPFRFMAITRDITERKRAERLLQGLNQVALAMERALTPEEISATVAEELKKLGFSCIVFLTDESQSRLLIRYASYGARAVKALEKLTGLKIENFSIPIETTDAYRKVIRERKAAFIENVEDVIQQFLPRPLKKFTGRIMRMLKIAKSITAPLIVEDEVIGLLSVESDDLTKDDVLAISAFAHQMAAAWRKAQLFEQAQDLTTKLKSIARPARQMSTLLDRDELVLQVVRSLQEITGCYNANLFLWEGDDLVLTAGKGGYVNGKPPLGYRLPLGQGVISQVAQSGQPVLVSDVSQDSRYVAWEGLPHTRSELAVPVKRGDRVLGVMDMQATEPNAFDATDLETLGVLADQLAVALDNARLYEEARQLAAFNESIVQSMAEGIIVEDTEGVFTFVNPAAAAIMGYSPEELLGQHWMAIIPPDQHPIVHAVSERRMRGEADRYELELVRKDGRQLSALVSGSPRLEKERFAGTLTVFTDITKRKRAERLLQALNQAALAMERALTTEEIFVTVAEELKKLGFSCIVFLTDESQSKLFVRHFSYEAKAIKALEKLTGLKIEDLSISIETADVYRKVVQERKAAFVENVEDVIRQFLPKPLKKFTGRITRMLKIAKSIPAPLVVEDKVIGVLAVESDDLTEDDIPAISAFAHQMAAAWRKAQLMQDLESSLAEQKQAQEELQHALEKLREALGGIIQTVALMVETRDPYTAGHQRRVADLARAIANEMGLPQEQIDGIRMAGLIHDLGKINVPAEILSKPTRLTEFERGMIQTHPQVGYDILKTIDFPWPVAQIVLQHHERMDGSGYPQGLSGEEITLEARVLAVADVVEAMASFRPYRPAHGLDKALEEISQNRGVLYDPEVVDACVKLFTEKGFTSPPPDYTKLA